MFTLLRGTTFSLGALAQNLSSLVFTMPFTYIASRAVSYRTGAKIGVRTVRKLSSRCFDLFNPEEEHAALRSSLRSFVENEVCVWCAHAWSAARIFW